MKTARMKPRRNRPAGPGSRDRASPSNLPDDPGVIMDLREACTAFNADIGLRQMLHGSDRSGACMEWASGNEILWLCAPGRRT